MDALAPTPPQPVPILPAARRAEDDPALARPAPATQASAPAPGAQPLPALPASVQRSQLDPEPPPPPLMTREEMAALLLSLTT